MSDEMKWLPISEAPEIGTFLVFMPDEQRANLRIQVARWHPNVKIIGSCFAFDCTKPTHFMPLPPEPTP